VWAPRPTQQGPIPLSTVPWRAATEVQQKCDEVPDQLPFQMVPADGINGAPRGALNAKQRTHVTAEVSKTLFIRLC